MIDYLRELAAWNRAYNLTAVHAPADMVDLHLLDSLSVLPHVAGGRVADVGSGAGLPGIPIALACPERRFALIDSRRKRVLFLRHLVRRLGLGNVDVVHARVEDYRQDSGVFHTVVSRAFARLDDMLGLCAHLCAPGGRILAMKGRAPQAELQAVGAGFAVDGVYALQVPGLRAERHLVVISPQSEQVNSS